MIPHLIPPLARRSSTARSVALAVLLDCERHEAFIQEVLNDHLTRSSLAGPDRRLATQLAYGVIRRRASLDALLAAVSKREKRQVDPPLWEILRLGAFQLALLERIPAHAAVKETVELVPPVSRPANIAGAKGFANGVLRSVGRLVAGKNATEPAADALPVDDGRYLLLTQPVLPDPTEVPANYLAAAFSLPLWLAQRY